MFLYNAYSTVLFFILFPQKVLNSYNITFIQETSGRHIFTDLYCHENHPAGTSITLRKKKTSIHQVITMLATSKYVLFPDHNHLLTTDTDDPTL